MLIRLLLLISLLSISLLIKSYASCFQLAADHFSLEPEILYSIAKVESSLRNDVLNVNKNKSIDIGMMQINTIHQKTLKQAGVELTDLLDPCINIMVGAWLLKESINASNGNLWQGVGRYHSKTPHLKNKYSDKVKKVYQNIKGHERIKLRNM